MTRAEYETDVILLKPEGSSFEFLLKTPDGDVIDPSTAAGTAGIEYVDADTVTYYRISLPAAVGSGAHEGTWHALLHMDPEAFREYLQWIEETDPRGFDVVRTHGVRYTLNVHAQSNLRLHASIAQDSLEPGATMTIRARLREYERLPVSGSATVRADLEEPDGTTYTLALDEISPGVFETTHMAHHSGVYPVRVHAEGTTAQGRHFTREHLLTGAVYRGGDDPLPTGHNGTVPDRRFCELLLCLTEEAFAEYFEERGVDVDAIRRCLKKYCEPDRDRDRRDWVDQLDPQVVERLVRDLSVLEAFLTITDAIDTSGSGPTSASNSEDAEQGK